MKRDPQKDLEICKKATKGPWSFGDTANHGYHLIMPYLNAHGEIKPAAILRQWIRPPQGENDMKFIAESREALPHWINRAVEAEKLLEQAAEEIENCYGKETELSKKLRGFLGDGKG